MTKYEDLHNPQYPDLGTRIAKLRKARDPQHGAAVLEAFRARHRQELARAGGSSHAAPCVSGTWHRDGKAILKAVKAAQEAKLARALEEEHRQRTDQQVHRAYLAHMQGDQRRLVLQF